MLTYARYIYTLLKIEMPQPQWVSMLNKMSVDGWELMSVAAGVESKGSKDDKAGIFITRFLFKK